MTAIAQTIDRRTQRDTTGLVSSTLTITRRTALRYLRTPQLIVMATLQMSLFFLIYRYMFGGAIHAGSIAYVDYLVPGFVATGVLFSGIGAAVATAEDLEQGFVDRLRSLPIPRSSVLAARAIADTAILTLASAVTVAIAFAVGFRLHGSVTDGLAAFALVIIFGFAFEWLFITMGLLAGTGQAAQGMGMVVFPLAFVSSAYVTVASMPGWLQVFAKHQPLTYMVDAVRALTLGSRAHVELGHPSSYYVVRSLIWAAAILAVAVPLAVAKYQRS
jgi:ABC-2 type transport system permease protein